MYGLIWRTTVSADQCTAAYETHWMRHMSRRRRVRLMFDGQWQCAAETGTIYDVFTGSARRRHRLTWAGAWWPGLVSRYTDSYARSSRRVSEWVDTGQPLQCWYHYDFDSTRYDEHSGPFCTHSLAHHWCNCRPPVPTQAPNALHDRSTQGTWVRGSHGWCARRATSIRRRRWRCGMWAAHARDVRSCTISYDIWPPRYRTLDESAIDIAISCNRYDH